ncbi:MAG: hypothetical protein ACNA8W_14790 [Bradymonadaceae bacterium]
MKFISRGILWGCCLGMLAGLVGPSAAWASPWTLPTDELGLTVDYTFQYADREFLPDGTFQAFPLEGASLSHTMRLGARYGFTDKFEGAVDVEFKQITYQAQTVLLGLPEDSENLSEVNDTILDFNTLRMGAGDFYFHGRYNLRRGLIMITSETTLKLPTGYDAPQGTFNDEMTSVLGQATLGDAQTDLTQSLLLGGFLPATKTFARLDAGLRLRFGAPGPQAVGALKVGQFIGDTLLLIGGLRAHQTIAQGDRIGVTMTAIDPTIPRSQFTEDNIRSVDLYLDSDLAIGEAGVLFRLGDFELTANYGYTFRGRNVAASHSVSIGTIFAIDGVTARD